MQIVIRNALISLALLSLTACDEIQQRVENVFYKGTHIGVQKCIERNKVDVVSERTIKLSCTKKHQKQVWVDLNGKSGYRSNFGTKEYTFSGYVENKSINAIVTSFEVIIHHDDMADNVSDKKRFDNVWIEPSQTFYFSFEVSEIKHQPNQERLEEENAGYYGWYTSNEMGVEIQTE